MKSLKYKGVFIIAEVAQAHDGSLGIAHSYIDAAAQAGADAVKFQTHIASAESTPHEKWRVKFSRQDASRYDYWKRMEFSEKEWKGLKEHAEEKGLVFFSSPFSSEAIELLKRVGVGMWKIASGEINNLPFLEEIASTGLPVIISTGMSNWEEIDRIVDFFKSKDIDITLMQCTSMYPTPPEKIGLNIINEFKEKYDCRAGLSDHSGLPYTSIAAAALGAEVIEVHLTFSKDMFGPDVPASLTVEEMSEMVKGVRLVEKIISNPVDKDEMAEELKDMKLLFNKSIVANCDIKQGTLITKELLSYKKPGSGISPAKVASVLGKKAKREISKDELINFTDIE